jgi:hypothetical protein
MKTIITIQSKRSEETEWKTRNAFRDLNAALITEQKTEKQAIDEANKFLHDWQYNYPQDAMLRVHVARH